MAAGDIGWARLENDLCASISLDIASAVLAKMLSIAVTLLAFTVVLADGPVQCYQCNSAEDSDCESSNVDQLKKFIKTCEPLKDGTYKNRQPIACRKIIQDVEVSPRRIIRECAYTGDTHMDGMRKQGNKAVKLTYYQCENVANVRCFIVSLYNNKMNRFLFGGIRMHKLGSLCS
ncbi:hypothetical protein Tcan_16507 [Toxocara canis]|uniref:Protein sleepless n=1 Tax=Toxocara canis TaxID=6265 RepID=A0A0B2VT48_TOXCA|nr:hypothetical protein Tcan_16507 [Toxocara canis]